MNLLKVPSRDQDVMQFLLDLAIVSLHWLPWICTWWDGTRIWDPVVQFSRCYHLWWAVHGKLFIHLHTKSFFTLPFHHYRTSFIFSILVLAKFYEKNTLFPHLSFVFFLTLLNFSAVVWAFPRRFISRYHWRLSGIAAGRMDCWKERRSHLGNFNCVLDIRLFKSLALIVSYCFKL